MPTNAFVTAKHAVEASVGKPANTQWLAIALTHQVVLQVAVIAVLACWQPQDANHAGLVLTNLRFPGP